MGGVVFQAFSPRDLLLSSYSYSSSSISHGNGNGVSQNKRVDEQILHVKNYHRYHPYENNGPYTVLYKIGE